MNTIEPYHAQANAILTEAGFHERGLADTEFPDIERTKNGTHYAVVGDRDADHIVLEEAPYLTPVDKPHYLLRLMAQQAVLGEGFAVVGVEAFNPAQATTHEQRKALASGSFAPLSANVLRVGEDLRMADHQTTSLYGYSLGADVAIQTAYDLYTNENRGVLPVAGLGAIETARVAKRGAVGAMKAMAASGKGLFKNITESDMLALNEAWAIDPDLDPKKQAKALDGLVNSGLVGYMLLGARNNAALIRGFGTDASVRQLNALSHTQLPTVLGRQEGSTVCPQEFIDKFAGTPDFATYTEVGNDHSADDNLVKSAGRMLHFTNAIVR